LGVKVNPLQRQSRLSRTAFTVNGILLFTTGRVKTSPDIVAHRHNKPFAEFIS
jgi:hypothetical protein